MEFWQKTLEPDIFWSAMSAIGTLSAVVIALFLPFALDIVRRQRITSAITVEISNNKALIENILDAWQRRDSRTDGTSGYKQELEIDAYARHLSTDLWKAHRFEISTVPYRCFNPFYVSIEMIIDPDRFAATGTLDNMDSQSLAEFRSTHSKLFLQGLKKTANKCRYLRKI